MPFQMTSMAFDPSNKELMKTLETFYVRYRVPQKGHGQLNDIIGTKTVKAVSREAAYKRVNNLKSVASIINITSA